MNPFCRARIEMQTENRFVDTVGKGEREINSRVALKHIHVTMLKQIANGSCCITQGANQALCDDLEGGWGHAVGRSGEEGAHVHLWLIHVAVQQKPTQRYKTIILQLKTNSKTLC